MQSEIFLVDGANALSPMKQSAFASEDSFQTLLADHPDLLSALAGNGSALMLVRREAAVPDDDAGSGRWSLDHLFLDQEGVPVLVEVKRATDTRTRREVVAQALEYAANAVAYWPIEFIKAAIEESVRAQGSDPDEALAAFVGSSDIAFYWQAVDANLRAGRVRIAIIADRIPKELQRIVEFLNEQMRPAEMLAVEIKHYAGDNGVRLLMPRLIGNTSRSEGAKAAKVQEPPETPDAWLSALEREQGPGIRKSAEKILGWAQTEGLQADVTSSGDAIAINLLMKNGKRAWPFFIRKSNGKLETSLKFLAFHHPYTDDSLRESLLGRFRAIPNNVIATEKNKGTPGIPLDRVDVPEIWAAWTEIADQIIRTLRT